MALVIGALVLGYLALTSGLANVLARSNPQLATKLDGRNAEALGRLAHRRLLVAANQTDVRAVDQLSRQALARSPMQVGALRNLGFLAEVDKRMDDAKTLMTTAAQVSHRDALTQAWLFTHYANKGDVALAVQSADIAMRMTRSYRDLMVGELLKLSNNDRLVEPMVQALQPRPDWRSRFMARLGDPAADPNNIYRILSTLKQRDSAPNSDELGSYFARFDGSRNAAQLWQRWQYLTPAPEARKGLIRDGGFEGLEAPPPFNWTLFVSPGVFAEREPCPDGCAGRVLYLSYDGNRSAAFAHQMLALKPGRYQLAFNVYSEGDDVSSMVASLRCGGKTSTDVIGERPFAATNGKWTVNRVEFDVTPQCQGQQLYFVGNATFSSASISAWLDNVTLSSVSIGAGASRDDESSD